ncbi:MAG: TRAP transporter small permease [Chloroflexi bacterium]|nr:TRAP transporter small permease [Chloroflexota bacterium]
MDSSLIVMLALIAASAAGLTWVLRGSRRMLGVAPGPWGIVELVLALFFMLGMLYASALQVIVRYALSDFLTVPWTEEFARLLLVWAAFWGALMAHRSDEHIGVAVLFDTLPPLMQRVGRLLGDLVAIGFLAVVVWHGWQAAQLQHAITTITLGLPVAAFAYTVPVCGTLMILYTLRLFVMRLRGRPVHGTTAQEV